MLPANAHAKKQIAKIARSIRQFGFTIPIVVDENNVILAGHGRWLAAQHLGREFVPGVVLFGLSATERRAYLLADNKLIEKAGCDRAAVALELEELAPLLANAGLDIHLTGPAGIDVPMGNLIDPEEDPADELPDIRNSDRSAAKVTCGSLVGIACELHIKPAQECI
jgi:hypothetical protein